MVAAIAGEGVAVALRFLLYLDLLIVAGLLLCAGQTAPADVQPRSIAALAALGAAITVAHFTASVAAMVGGDSSALDIAMVRFMALEMGHGRSALVRLFALGTIAYLMVRPRPSRTLPGMLGLLALASLAWSGHAGAGDGATGVVHLASDIVHLVAAALWIATLILLLVALARRGPAIEGIIVALRRFATTGTAIVVILIITGLINLGSIVDVFSPTLLASGYGQALAFKIALFFAMLVFAAANRWHITPRLERSAHRDGRAIRASLVVELCLAIAVVMVVALLGTLSPNP